MAQPPPASLVNSAWRPHIADFALRVNQLFATVWRPTSQGVFTSWWRSPAVNAEARGDPESQHLFALAADFSLDPRTRDEIVREAPRFGLTAVPFDGARGGFPEVHIQRFPAGTLRRAGVVFPV